MSKTRYIISCAAAVICVTMLTGSCSGVRNLKQPSLSVPSETVRGYTDSLSYADMQWWEYYTDPTLKSLIGRALENNRDMLGAAARVEELRQLYGVQKLNYMPTVTAAANATKETNDYYGEKFKNDPEVGVKGTVSWEVDLWGALSYAKRQSGAAFMASVENMRGMQMTVVAEVATAYFNLVALDKELDIVRTTLANRSEALAAAKPPLCAHAPARPMTCRHRIVPSARGE